MPPKTTEAAAAAEEEIEAAEDAAEAEEDAAEDAEEEEDAEDAEDEGDDLVEIDVDADLHVVRSSAAAILRLLAGPTDTLVLQAEARKMAEAFVALDEALTSGEELPLDWED